MGDEIQHYSTRGFLLSYRMLGKGCDKERVCLKGVAECLSGSSLYDKSWGIGYLNLNYKKQSSSGIKTL